MKPSPAQSVNKNFGGRSGLVDKLLPMVDDLRDEGQDALRSRLMALPNKKLLRLYDVEQKVRERFGDRAKLVQHILDARGTAGLSADANLKGKLEGLSKAQLLDMTREKHSPRKAKQTPEQRMAKKRGKKQRARAQAKAG